MLALFIVVCITAITMLGSNPNNTFGYVGTQIGGSSSWETEGTLCGRFVHRKEDPGRTLLVFSGP